MGAWEMLGGGIRGVSVDFVGTLDLICRLRAGATAVPPCRLHLFVDKEEEQEGD